MASALSADTCRFSQDVLLWVYVVVEPSVLKHRFSFGLPSVCIHLLKFEIVKLCCVGLHVALILLIYDEFCDSG